MQTNRYVALLAQSGNPENEDQRLHLDMLCFLDDRHVPVTVLYDDRLPGWGRRHAGLAQLYYFFKLIIAPPSVVLADFSLCGKIGWAILASVVLKRHRIIVSACRLPGNKGSFLKRWLLRTSIWACLKSAYRILVPSEALADQMVTLAAVHDKIRYLSYPQHNLSMDAGHDEGWWPLTHFKPRSHVRHQLESLLNSRISSN